MRVVGSSAVYMATGSVGVTGIAGPIVPSGPVAPVMSIRKSFPGETPSIVQEIKMPGAILQVRAKSTISADSGGIRITPEVDAVLRGADGAEVMIARMGIPEIYEYVDPNSVPFERNVSVMLKALDRKMPKGVEQAGKDAARASMRMSTVLMAEIHLDYLREEDFAEAWRSANVLHVMDT